MSIKPIIIREFKVMSIGDGFARLQSDFQFKNKKGQVVNETLFLHDLTANETKALGEYMLRNVKIAIVDGDEA